jgi:hypothetical protein
MKPKELLNYCGENLYARAETEKSITPYLNEECVVAYDKNKLGVIFIIKTKKKYFCYVGLRNYLYIGGYGYNYGRMGLNEIMSLLGDDCVILNKDEYSKIKKKMIMENL